MAAVEPQFGAPMCPLSSEESYNPMLQESIHHLLQKIQAGASDFSHFHLIFSRLVQTIPSPPVEIIWFYGAVNVHTHKAIVGHHDPKVRLAGLKDLFHLLVACSESSTSLKRVAVLAPLVFELYNLVQGLKIEKNPCLDGNIYEEICCLLERIVSFISICCCSSAFAHDNSPALSCCFLDLVRVWTFQRCQLDMENTDYFKVFFPAVSQEIHNRLREGCGVGYLAGVVMFQCFLLRLCLNLGSFGAEKKLLAGDMVTGFRSCYFFDVLMEMLLEPTLSVTCLLSPTFPSDLIDITGGTIIPNRDGEVLLQKALFYSIITVDYPFSHPESDMHTCSTHLKGLAMSWLFAAEKALSFLRERLDKSEANAYAEAFFNSVSHSRLMGWLINKLCINDIVIQRVSSCPAALFDWIADLHNQVSDPDILRLQEKVKRFRSRPNTKTCADLEMVSSIPGVHCCSESNERGRKRKDVTHAEMGLQFKMLKHHFCDNSFNRSLPFQNDDGWVKKNEMGSPSHEDDMEIIDASCHVYISECIPDGLIRDKSYSTMIRILSNRSNQSSFGNAEKSGSSGLASFGNSKSLFFCTTFLVLAANFFTKIVVPKLCKTCEELCAVCTFSYCGTAVSPVKLSSYETEEDSENDSLRLRLFAIILFLYRLQAAWIKQDPHASTSTRALTVLVEEGRADLGSNAQASNSSPQKSPGPNMIELKNPVRPPFVVELSSFPLMMKSISVTGSSSRTMKVP
ncbi:hypothetical protein V2J09_009343 [Rumex salicifolius]